MLETINKSINKFDFEKVSDLTKDEFSNLLSTVFEDFVKSDEFNKLAIKCVLTAMNNNLRK